MSFIRNLDKKQIDALHSDKNSRIFDLLSDDVRNGAVFPAIRKNEIHFYYEGGCLYKFANGRFSRDAAYKKYFCEIDDLSPYDTAKRQLENKFTNTKGDEKERRLLNKLYRHTYCREYGSDTVVLDIEVNLNGSLSIGKNCDLVLYNTISNELMFTEGKVFSDRRVNVKCGNTPEVIEQVKIYTAAIKEQGQAILKQYENYIDIINRLFGTSYKKPIRLIRSAKLLIYETPLSLTDNNVYSINAVNDALGQNNVAWFKKNERPSIDEIWNALCK